MKYTPRATTDAEMAFGPRKIKDYLPDYQDVPAEFKRFSGNKHVDIVSRWFFEGLPRGTEFIPREGIDTQTALAHIRTCMSSWEPKHEHKTAGVAFLLSEWFDDILIPDTKE